MFKWSPLSLNQMKLLSWWTEDSPYKNSNGVIAEGAVRSGKTILMTLSFVVWSMSFGGNYNFALCGKTIGSLKRNVITPIKEILINRGYKVVERKTEGLLYIYDGNKRNTYYLFGGRDERSQDLVQGVTLAGALLDEVALMPQSFVEQVMARCSIEGSKFWFNCNPEGPRHWFYLEHVLKSEEKKYYRIHFSLEDNPSLSPEVIQRYKNMFTGIFYKRFILGEWAFADGIIYDCFDEDKNCYNNDNKKEVLPIQILENDPDGGYCYISSDYGVLNPMVYLEGYKFYKPGELVPYYYIENEYYYNSRTIMTQKTDQEYVQDLLGFIGSKRYNSLIIDPSASSLIVAARRAGIVTKKANNDVEEGIRMVYSLLSTGHIKINKDNCPNLISEIGLYIWDNPKGERGQEKPLKQNDHALDALRYLVRSTSYPSEVFA